ncbi:MAG: hypothetical protein JZL64_02640 [Ferrovum myxofaciens]|nr:transposase [Ferrovum myxofaciens]MBU6993918.1 hypothetical protein [Ferrovum myxofaciens]
MGDSFRYPQGCKLDQSNSRVFLPKLGWLKYRNSRDVLGTVSNITVSANGGKWFVSIQTEREVEQSVHRPQASSASTWVSPALQLCPMVVISNRSTPSGSTSKACTLPACHVSQDEIQQQLEEGESPRPEDSQRIANVRKDFLHKTTTTISKNHAIVCIEDLQVRKYVQVRSRQQRFARGAMSKPKSGLNKSILDQGWFEFRRQLEYKQVWLGGDVLAVSRTQHQPDVSGLRPCVGR